MWPGSHACPRQAHPHHPGLTLWSFIYLDSVIMFCELSWWLSGKESACQSRRHGFDPWIWKIPWGRKGQPTPVFLPGKSVDRSAAGYLSMGSQELDTT